MRATYHQPDGIFLWKRVYWPGNEAAWAIDYQSTLLLQVTNVK